MSYYHPGANPTVDLVIFRKHPRHGQEVLLIQRGGPVEKDKWAFPGGFVNTTAKKGEPFVLGEETYSQAAIRETQEETKLRVAEGLIKPIGIYAGRTKSGAWRDPRDSEFAFSESHAFYVRLPYTMDMKVKGMDDARDAQWLPLTKVEQFIQQGQMAFDHAQILSDALKLITPSIDV